MKRVLNKGIVCSTLTIKANTAEKKKDGRLVDCIQENASLTA